MRAFPGFHWKTLLQQDQRLDAKRPLRARSIWGSGGNGTTTHVAGELLKLMVGIDMVHVPYRGGAPMLIDLLGGQLQVTFDPMPSAIEYVRSGKLRALAVTTATRSEALPDLPTVADVLPGYEASTWYGVGAPRNTPSEIIAKLNIEINAALVDPKMKARLADLAWCWQVRTPTSESSSPKKPRSGPRSSSSPAPSRTDLDRFSCWLSERPLPRLF